MNIRVQTCWNGSLILQRLLICGGLLIRSDEWNRRTATQALDLLSVELPNVPRKSIRFIHT